MLPPITEVLTLISQWSEITDCQILEYEKEGVKMALEAKPAVKEKLISGEELEIRLGNLLYNFIRGT